MKKVTASAPGKLLLFGDHAVVYGHPCIVTAINQRVFVTVELRDDDVFAVTAETPYQKKLSKVGSGEVPKQFQFLEAVMARFLTKYSQQKGVTVSTQSDFSSQFGFGSSSAVSVAFAKALCSAHEIDLSQQQLFDLTYQAILDVQKRGSGFDLAAAIWGGTLYYVTPAKVVEQLKVTAMPLVVGYTGMKVSTATIVAEVAEAKLRDTDRIDRLFQRSSDIVELARTALEKTDWPMVGHLMNQNQTMLAELGVSSPELYKLIEASKKVGAFGAKLSGAGRGDCMIAVASHEKIADIELAITTAGGEPLSVETGAEGVRLEK